MPLKRLLLVALLICPLALAAEGRPGAELHLATWNLEWLLNAQSSLDLRVRCQRGERRLPCDVAQTHARSEADLQALRRHAERLDADVVALQEVEDATAAARVFRGYAFCFSSRRDRQNVGFAVRRGLPFRCEDDVDALSLADRVRRGSVLTLFPGEPRELRLLSVHLKSGCSREPLDAAMASCRTLARQAPVLADWVDEQMASGRAFAILGDFNRDLRGDRADASGLWARMADGRPRVEVLRDALDDKPFVACQPGQSFTRYIDYVLLGGPLVARLVPGSGRRHPFSASDAYRYRLSDHCPLSARVRLR